MLRGSVGACSWQRAMASGRGGKRGVIFGIAIMVGRNWLAEGAGCVVEPDEGGLGEEAGKGALPSSRVAMASNECIPSNRIYLLSDSKMHSTLVNVSFCRGLSQCLSTGPPSPKEDAPKA